MAPYTLTETQIIIRQQLRPVALACEVGEVIYLTEGNPNVLTAKRGIKYLRVEYDEGNDTYTVKRMHTRKFDLIVDAETSGVYWEDLFDMAKNHLGRGGSE